MDETRYYFFGPSENNLTRIEVANSGYLKPDRIKHYEDVFGPLYCVRYKGRVVLA